MSKSVLVVGGAGFIGSHLVDKLIEEGNEVRVLDSLEPQIHPKGMFPSYINPKADLVKGTLLNEDLVLDSLEGVEVVFHQASVVGVAQSMYEVSHYVKNNSLATACLLNVLVNKEHSVKKLLIAGSMSSYGEGTYDCRVCGERFPFLREQEQLNEKQWEFKCGCRNMLEPIPTRETKALHPNSIYAISKRNQEEMALSIGRAYELPTTVLRYFNVFGSRQSLNNPYTGIIPIFLNSIKNGVPPMVFEDGLQSRDFVCVEDIVKANLLAMNSSSADFEVLNIGSGKPSTVKGIAEILIELNNSDLKPNITNVFRKGDVRHCFADISKAKELLGFSPSTDLKLKLSEVIAWSEKEKLENKFSDSIKILKKHELIG